MTNSPLKHLSVALLCTWTGLAALGILLYLILPEGNLMSAQQLLTVKAAPSAAPEPAEYGCYILLCLAAIPLALGGWHLAKKLPSLPVSEWLLLPVIPLLVLTGWTGKPLIPVLAGAILISGFLATRPFVYCRRKNSHWPVWTAMGLVLLFTWARRFPLGTEVSVTYDDHLDIVYYALNAAVHRMQDTHLYGFYPHILAPLFRITGLGLLSAALVMNALYLTAFWLMADAARRLIRNDFLLAGFLIPATVICGNATLLEPVPYSFDPYFAYWPVRFLFPALAVNLITRSIPPMTCGWSSLLAASAVWFNPDTGLVVAGAFGAIFLFRKHYKELLLFTGMFLLALPGIAILLYLANGVSPDWMGYLTYMDDFTRSGYMLVPISGFAGVLPVLIISGILVLVLRHFPVRNTEVPLLFLAVLGTGLLCYYVGRSVPGNLLAASWPTLLLWGIVVDRSSRMGRPHQKYWLMTVGLFPACSVLILLTVYQPRFLSRDLKRQCSSLSAPNKIDAEAETIRKMTSSLQEVNILPKYHQGILYAETGLKPGIRNFGLSENLFRKNEMRIMQELQNAHTPVILTLDNVFPPPIARGYRLAEHHQALGIRLYLPLNPHATPVPHPPAKPSPPCRK